MTSNGLNIEGLEMVQNEVWATRNNVKERVCEKLEELNPGRLFSWTKNTSEIFDKSNNICVGIIKTTSRNIEGHTLILFKAR